MKTASHFNSESFHLLYPKFYSSFYSNSPVDATPNCESENSTNKASTSTPQPVSLSYIMRERRKQLTSSSSTSSTSSSISTLLRQHAQHISSTFETFFLYLSDIPISLRLCSGTDTSFTVNSYQDLHISLETNNQSLLWDLSILLIFPILRLKENFRPPAIVFHNYPLTMVVKKIFSDKICEFTCFLKTE